MPFKANLFGKDKTQRCVEQGGHFPNGANVLRPSSALRPVHEIVGEGDHSLEWWTTCSNCGLRYQLPDKNIMVIPAEPEINEDEQA